MKNKSEFLLLSTLRILNTENPHANQRDISRSLNMSLGLTNVLLKRLTARGWVLMQKISTKNIQYILTAEGIKEFIKRSTQYTRKTLHTVKQYKNKILFLIQNAKEIQCTRIVLIGISDIDFIIEYACQTLNISFIHSDTMYFKNAQTDFIFVSETVDSYESLQHDDIHYFYLSQLFIGAQNI